MNGTLETPIADGQSPGLAEAVIRQWTWKTPAMREMTLRVCCLALARGAGEFSANDLPEFAHGGGGIAGAVFNRLARDGVLSPVGIFAVGVFVQKFVKNPGGNRIGVWRLKNGALARRALELHGAERAEKWAQGELIA